MVGALVVILVLIVLTVGVSKVMDLFEDKFIQ